MSRALAISRDREAAENTVRRKRALEDGETEEGSGGRERGEPCVERRTRNGFENTYAVAVVEAGRSWPALIRHLMLEGGVPGPEARRARLSSSHPGPGRLIGPTSISLFPVIAPDPTPRPPPTEGSLLFLRSAIRQIAIDTDDPLFLFFSSVSFLLFLSLSRFLSFPFSPSVESPLSFALPPALPPFKSSAKGKRQFFHLGARDNTLACILLRAFFIYLVLFSESPVRHAFDRAADNADRYRCVRKFSRLREKTMPVGVMTYGKCS